MKCLILGCGGSNGVPEINCDCFVCTNDSSYNKRTRSSIIIESSKGIRLLVDTSPDMRSQFLNHKINYINGIIYTHSHYDHIGGIGDVKKLVRNKRKLNFHPFWQKVIDNKTIPAFLDEITYDVLNKSFKFIFQGSSNGLYQPLLTPQVFQGNFTFCDIEVMPFKQKHGDYFSYGFRFGDIAYSTDINQLNDQTAALLFEIPIWIVDCTKYYFAPTHFYLEETLNAIAAVKAKKVILTHMSHEIEYHELKRILPPHVIPAYDGMVITV